MYTNDNLKSAALTMAVTELVGQIKEHGIVSLTEYEKMKAGKSETEKKMMDMSKRRPVVYRDEERAVIGCPELMAHSIIEQFDEKGAVVKCYDFGSIDVCAVTVPGVPTAQVEIAGEDVSIVIHSNGAIYSKFM